MPIFSVIVLAAGGSSRLGHPKQLVQFQGKTLVEHSASIGLGSDADETLVVLGARSEEIIPHIAELNAVAVINPEWKDGISTSICEGILNVDPGSEAVVILLCDQPKVTSDHLNALAAKTRWHPAVATDYGDAIGVPVAFRRDVFPELLQLTGDNGAKELLSTLANVATIPLAEAQLDVDAPEDVIELNKN